MRGVPSDAADAELIRAAGSDAASFGALYERHAMTVYTWFHRRLERAAGGLTAETFAQAWLSRDRFRDERGGSALPWLLGIARNVLRETIRLDRVKTRARERLGLPLDLAVDEGYEGVEKRLVGGRPATHLVLRVRKDFGCDPGFFFTWESQLWGAFWPGTDVGDKIRVWIVDVGGTRLFIEAETKEAGRDIDQEITRIVESIRFN